MTAFGDFLHELRKEKGLTQAELADILGVTNKAVSKWETGEAMPETSLLIPIATTFGVTVDELLSGRRDDDVKEEINDIPDPIKQHLFTRGKDDEPETIPDKICGAVCAAVMLGGIAVYLFLGAFANLWHPYWVIIPICALACGVIGIIFRLCDSQKRISQIKKGKNPYTDGASGIVVLSCIIAYLCLGAFANLWHPYWVIIIAGIAAAGIMGASGNVIAAKHKK